MTSEHQKDYQRIKALLEIAQIAGITEVPTPIRSIERMVDRAEKLFQTNRHLDAENVLLSDTVELLTNTVEKLEEKIIGLNDRIRHLADKNQSCCGGCE